MLCLIALVGYILPLININMNNISGESTSKDISLLSVFQDPSSILENESILSSDRFAGMADVLSNTTRQIKTIMALFAVSLFITIIVLVFIIINKFKAITAIILSGVLFLPIYIGTAISSLSRQFIQSLEQGLGFLASLITLSDFISIKIGVGYFVTIGAIGFLTLLQLLSIKNQKTYSLPKTKLHE
jgi:cation transport ATPase